MNPLPPPIPAQAPPRHHRAPQSHPLTSRSVWLLALIPLLCTLTLLRCCAQAVPWGVPPLPWLMARVEGPQLTSPAGVTISVHYNDAGAAHSGDHCCWIIKDSWWSGPRVIAEGYVTSSTVVDERWQSTWINDHTLEIDEPVRRTRKTPPLPRQIRLEP